MRYLAVSSSLALCVAALASCGNSPPIKESAELPAQTPAQFRVEFETTTGNFVVEAHREWAPKGVDRFYELVRKSFFNHIAFFRVIPGFMVQFGIHGDPEEAGEWRGEVIKDDPVKQSNTRGMISFATTGKNSRTTQMFINFGDNSRLDARGFAPFAKVIRGMEVVDKIYPVGEGAPRGPGPRQDRIQYEGNAYLRKAYPKLDYISGGKLVR